MPTDGQADAFEGGAKCRGRDLRSVAAGFDRFGDLAGLAAPAKDFNSLY